jgi:hypothetical protein
MVSLRHRKHCVQQQHSRWTQHLGDEVPASAVLQATLVVLVDALCCLVGTYTLFDYSMPQVHTCSLCIIFTLCGQLVRALLPECLGNNDAHHLGLGQGTVNGSNPSYLHSLEVGLHIE